MHLVGLQMPNCTIGPDQFRALSDPPAAGRYEGGAISIYKRWTPLGSDPQDADQTFMEFMALTFNCLRWRKCEYIALVNSRQG